MSHRGSKGPVAQVYSMLKYNSGRPAMCSRILDVHEGAELPCGDGQRPVQPALWTAAGLLRAGVDTAPLRKQQSVVDVPEDSLSVLKGSKHQ